MRGRVAGQGSAVPLACGFLTDLSAPGASLRLPWGPFTSAVSLLSLICRPKCLAIAPRFPWLSGSWPCWGQMFMPICNCAIPVTLK